MKDKSAIIEKIRVIDEMIKTSLWGGFQRDIPPKLLTDTLKEYRDLLEHIVEREEYAHSECCKPNQDWTVGYWKAIDHLCQRITGE